VFNDRFLPPDFQDNMEAALHSYRHEINADKIWELSKCTAIVTSMRRRLLYMGMHPSSFMKGSQMLDNIVNKFVPYVSGEPKVHEEVSSDTGISGELDIRVGTTIIDIKTSISDDITPVHLLQLLAYKALWDANNEKKIEVVGVFNPLRGWYVPIDVSGWSCHSELLNYLYERRQT
jgi:CRISPR/Cas system-associated exonuclease Cas4 (RecB family)